MENVNTYTWIIEYMNTSTQTVNGFTEAVLNCGWRCNATSSQTHSTTNQYGTITVPYTASVYGTCSFPEPPANDPNFVPYANLTQATVLQWIWDNGVNENDTQATLDTLINNQINPPVVQNKLPWA